MRVKPLPGCCLVEMLDRERFTPSGIEIPDHTPSPEEIQASHKAPTKPPGLMGIVREVGPWPKLSNGMLEMPEFAKGAKVVVPFNAGVELRWEGRDRLKLFRNWEILAVLS